MNCRGKLQGLIPRLRSLMPDFTFGMMDDNTIIGHNTPTEGDRDVILINTFETINPFTAERVFKMHIIFPDSTSKTIIFDRAFNYVSG